ncbi:ribonuclease BN [Natrialba aegyptia DSM 13077]|uniref:Ribonuclease BN n=1 Tax=Natrialba aegyptia DSM 13077 TaxID=1227491 RepID=M0B294_9EURY|nr:ribonuclease BN [Natrialba aegyptia DSM 13077]
MLNIVISLIDGAETTPGDLTRQRTSTGRLPTTVLTSDRSLSTAYGRLTDTDTDGEFTRTRQKRRCCRPKVPSQRHLRRLAYHAFNALIPLLILLLVGMSLVDTFEPLLRAVEAATELEGVLTQDALLVTGTTDTNIVRAGTLAFVILLWSGARLFRAVNSAFAEIYGARKTQSSVANAATVPLVTAVNAALLTATVALGVTLDSVVDVSLSVFVGGTVATAASSVLLAFLLLVVFFPMYYLFPPAGVSARDPPRRAMCGPLLDRTVARLSHLRLDRRERRTVRYRRDRPAGSHLGLLRRTLSASRCRPQRPRRSG